MPYATREDMKDRFGEAEIAGLESGGAVVSAALSDASAEADSYVGVRHVLPLPPGRIYPALKWAVCDIARYRLWEAKINDETDTVYVRYRRAVRFLEALADGTAVLADEDGLLPPSVGVSMRVRSGRPKTFTNALLNRMDYGRD